MSREKAADLIGVSSKTLQRAENGHVPRGEFLLKAAAAYGRSLSELDSMTPRVDRTVPRGTVRESAPTYADGWSELVAKFERGAVRLGATDAEADFLRAALELPQARALVAESGAERDEAAADLMRSLLRWLELRQGRKPPTVADMATAAEKLPRMRPGKPVKPSDLKDQDQKKTRGR